MKRQLLFIGVLVALLGIALAAGMSQAQEPGPAMGEVGAEGEVGVAAAVDRFIPIQGRLTDESGNPLNGTYTINFYLYDALGNLVCSDTAGNNVPVSNGLFTWNIQGDCGSEDINGQRLDLELRVEGERLTPRQPIYPIPYAFSLKPGAVISDSASIHTLVLNNNGPSSNNHALHAYSKNSNAVFASTHSPHAAVEGENYGGGPALYAGGSGIIQSTAATDWAVSPLKIVPGDASGDGDLRIVHSTQFGWVALYTDGADDGTALLPVDVVSLLFGTRVKFSEFHFCYSMADASLNDKITQVDVEYVKADGGHQNLCSFTTDVSNTSWTCAACTASSPVDIYGPVFVRFALHFDGDGADDRIRLGHMYVHLVE